MINQKFSMKNNYISFIDIDDTVFRTSAKILVKDTDNKTIHELSSYDFNNYILKDNEHFDFSQFKSSDIFFNTAEPIDSVVSKINRLLNIIKLKNGQDKIIFLTARPDFDNKQKFLDTFRNTGIPVDNKDIVYIERAGNINKPTSIAKAEIIDKYLSTKKYNVVRMIDDSIDNLNEFLKLHTMYPRIAFIAINVDKNGKLKVYHRINTEII